jgi:hypothetical protein
LIGGNGDERDFNAKPQRSAKKKKQKKPVMPGLDPGIYVFP